MSRPNNDQAPIYNITLILLTGENAQEGPGWYITGTAQTVDGATGYRIGPRRVAVPDAEEIARAFENLIPTNQDNKNTNRPFQLVREGTSEARNAIQKDLDLAEEIATTVPRLRKVLGELGGQ